MVYYLLIYFLIIQYKKNADLGDLRKMTSEVNEKLINRK